MFAMLYVGFLLPRRFFRISSSGQSVFDGEFLRKATRALKAYCCDCDIIYRSVILNSAKMTKRKEPRMRKKQKKILVSSVILFLQASHTTVNLSLAAQ